MLRIVRSLERGLYGLGILLMASWLVVILDSRLYQARHMQVHAESASAPADSAIADTVALHSVIGRIDIPRLGLSAAVTEGTDALGLLRAVGHQPGTALPGHPGNTVLAGHRDTYFRPLAHIARNDTIRMTTPHGRYSYSVVSTLIVPPTQTEVMSPSPTPMLTLITCYPFRYVGHAPLRFVVQAQEIPSASNP